MIAAERAAVSKEWKYEQTKLARELEIDKAVRASWDYEVIDEYGDTVWAKDLAQRYRKELNARRDRDFRARK